jgi:hypothetical protein
MRRISIWTMKIEDTMPVAEGRMFLLDGNNARPQFSADSWFGAYFEGRVLICTRSCVLHASNEIISLFNQVANESGDIS